MCFGQNFKAFLCSINFSDTVTKGQNDKGEKWE
jgi:hypothetical protein